MRTYCVLLHIFAALLLCDYGMFSTPSPSPSEMSTTAISATSDSNTVTTTGSITVGNDSSSLETGLEDEWPVDSNDTAESSGDSSDNESKSLNGSISGVISSTTHPASTTRNVKHLTTKQKIDSESVTGGIIILIIILILICFLLGILYILRKKARSYSFDLTRVDGPGNDYDTPLRSDQQGLSYEQTNKDLPVSLNYIQEDKSEEKTNPIANGSAGEKTEQTPTNENDEQNVPEENSFSSNSSLSMPVKKVEFNLDLDLLGSESELSAQTEAEATDAAQNENNNNVSNAGRGTAEEIFTEISLDEPKEHA
ncbi:uncharacterized protein LOC107653219 [Sinocyclocheilus anshuiensis]|uniref:uncharacterized protein LOC107653219 n=1 Tax=Sinocyclocheilus anshuiensis TaxID=1608454 RepID=UPI0007B8C6D2|nr:PREDICTED: uncharacterized protein LOC107653219 [Sinocyclocheilus anshuiensis]